MNKTESKPSSLKSGRKVNSHSLFIFLNNNNNNNKTTAAATTTTEQTTTPHPRTNKKQTNRIKKQTNKNSSGHTGNPLTIRNVFINCKYRARPGVLCWGRLQRQHRHQSCIAVAIGDVGHVWANRPESDFYGDIETQRTDITFLYHQRI